MEVELRKNNPLLTVWSIWRQKSQTRICGAVSIRNAAIGKVSGETAGNYGTSLRNTGLPIYAGRLLKTAETEYVIRWSCYTMSRIRRFVWITCKCTMDAQIWICRKCCQP